jgi:hypothetical protein
MTEKLLNCPFCGTEPRILGGPMAAEEYSIWCKNSHSFNGTMDKAVTIARWNTRVGVVPEPLGPIITIAGPACAACKKQPSPDCPNLYCGFRSTVSSDELSSLNEGFDPSIHYGDYLLEKCGKDERYKLELDAFAWRCLRATPTPTPSDASSNEPMAWRWKWSADSSWIYAAAEIAVKSAPILEPLYAATTTPSDAMTDERGPLAWTISPKTEAAIKEIDGNLRSARLRASDLVAGAATPPQADDAERERIARIVDPAIFEKFDEHVASGDRAQNGTLWAEVICREEMDDALEKADLILATRPLPSPAAVEAYVSPMKAGTRDLGICLDCGVNDGDDHAIGCSALYRNNHEGSQS